MQKIILSLSLGAAVAIAVAQQPGATNVLPHVVDQTIAAELLRGAVANQSLNVLVQSPDLQRNYVIGVIEQELVQEAARRGLQERLDVQRALMQSRYQILIQALQQDVMRRVPPPADAEVQAAYRKDKDRWVMPEAYRLLIFAADDTNTNAVAALRAAAGTTPPNAERLTAAGARPLLPPAAGEIWVTERDIVPEVWKALPSLRDGESRTFGVQNSVWLVHRIAYRKSGPMTFEQARDAIRAELLQQRQRQEWEAFLDARRRALGL
ncbi:MAG: peptidylprolyl isomerase [Kiritimatiellae bacterium]|nr:peptidylprolyl isomerase [Kiritimatiellia bacterium]